MSNMIFLVMAVLGWTEMAQRLNLMDRAHGIGDGVIDGYRYSIIRRGNRIYIVIPDYSPREKCREIAEKILQTLSPEAEVKVLSMGYASAHCNYCIEPTAYPYKCHRCGGWYCKDHRLPEKHNCPGSETVRAIHRRIVKEREKADKKAKGEKEIVAVEIPCG